MTGSSRWCGGRGRRDGRLCSTTQAKHGGGSYSRSISGCNGLEAGVRAGAMNESILGLYDPLSDYYHLMFEDWDKSIERQAGSLNSLLEAQLGNGPFRILDCACGIGTQAIGLARYGHRVVASDLSSAAVARARREAESRGLDILFHVSDMTTLAEIPDTGFDVVAALDNALPHLS